jgi:hypothetical protein
MQTIADHMGDDDIVQAAEEDLSEMVEDNPTKYN